MRIHWNRVATLLMFPIISSWLLIGTHQSSVPALPSTTTTVVVQPLPRVVVTTTTTLPLALTRWDTRSTDPTASWPDADDPTWDLPLGAQLTFACIRYLESRNHTFSVNVQSGAGGWYQCHTSGGMPGNIYLVYLLQLGWQLPINSRLLLFGTTKETMVLRLSGVTVATNKEITWQSP